MKSLLGCHWIREHPDNNRDFAHIERMQYPSIKLFKSAWDNRDFCRDLLSVLPKDAYILARDHALSEQKEGMWSDPVGHGTYHANEWAMKVASGQVHTPDDRTFFLGINEPDATDGDRNAIDLYTESFLDRLRVHGLRGGAFNFSTGHPRTVDGTANTQADYSVFERSHQAIVRGHHIGVLHIYGTAATPCAPGHFDRLKACTWQDVEWVVGECGVDEHVIGGGEHAGFHKYFNGRLDDYCGWLDTLIIGINDARIHSYQVFTLDFSHPWGSFDVREIRDALESYQWLHMKQRPPKPDAQPVDTHLPSVGTGPKPTGPTAIVNVPDGANLRTGPGTDYKIVGAVTLGTPLAITGKSAFGLWWQVEFKSGKVWVSGTVVAASDVANVPVVPMAQTAPQPTTPEPPQGDNWQRSIAFVRRWEGGWADNPADPGGATNKGITLGTYTRWRQVQAQPEPTKDDLRNLSDEEANRIFYEWYWLESGADKLPWPLCLAHMDTAVNAGVGKAQEMLHRSNGSFLAYVGHVGIWYTTLADFQHFGEAWARRRFEILLEASRT